MFTDRMGRAIPVNFVKATFNVEIPPPPCLATRFGLKQDEALGMDDLVRLTDCLFRGEGDCREIFTVSDLVILLNFMFSNTGPPLEDC